MILIDIHRGKLSNTFNPPAADEKLLRRRQGGVMKWPDRQAAKLQGSQANKKYFHHNTDSSVTKRPDM